MGERYVLYSWTADGIPERCRVSAEAVSGARCYHCGLPLDGEAARLDAPDGDVYLLHRECAYRGCGGFDRDAIDGAFGERA